MTIGRRHADEFALNGLFIKICGITTEEDALLAVALGADALGFVLAAGSTRQVSARQAAEIVRRVPPDVATIGVFRNEAPERVIDLTLEAGFTGAQLHGDETAAQTAKVASNLGLVIKAFGAGSRLLERAGDYPVEIVMIDNPKPGSGEVFDWSLADGAPDGKKLVLAGGLSPENVSDAITRVRPWGIDVSSGVEAGPGRKDPRKLRTFISAARSAYAALPVQDSSFPSTAKSSGPYDWKEEF